MEFITDLTQSKFEDLKNIVLLGKIPLLLKYTTFTL